MTEIAHVDFETYSEVDLKTAGAYKYAEHKSTDFTSVAYAGEGPVHVWLPWDQVPGSALEKIKQSADPGAQIHVGRHPPRMFEAILDDPRIRLGAHNAVFERRNLAGTAGQSRFLTAPGPERFTCSMAQAAVYGLPHALENAAAAIGSYPKRKVGVNEMRYFAKPRKDGSRPTPTEEPDRFVQLVLYNIDDVKAERDLHHKVPQITEREQRIWLLDQHINDRGVTIDKRMIEDMLVLIEAYKGKLSAWCKAQTGYSPTQTGKLADWIRANGYAKLPDLQAPTVLECLDDPSCPPNIQKVLRCYSTYAMKAVSKYDAAMRAVCADGRLHGMFKHYGAGPGRWSSVFVQLQNMMRPLIADADVAIEACRLRDLSYLHMLYDLDPMKVIASCARGMLVADEGHDLIAHDFSQIEAVIRSWVSDDESMLQVFRDGRIKSYKVQGSKMFGPPPERIVDEGASQLYTAAKIGDLACGFQGWAAAVNKMARQMGIKLTMEAEEIAGRWRDANPRVVKTWGYLEAAAAAAVRKPGQAYAIPNRKISFKVEGRWLYMRLPSGRKIAYLDPAVAVKVEEPNDDHSKSYKVTDNSVSHMGVNTYTRQWGRNDDYGGKWMQNVTEGIGRDILTNGLLHAEDAGYKTNMTVHDEGVAQVPKGFGSLEEANRLMVTPMACHKGMPVKAHGWRGPRYHKE